METIEIETTVKRSRREGGEEEFQKGGSVSMMLPLMSAKSPSGNKKVHIDLEKSTGKEQLALIASGDEKAFQEFYRAHIGPLYGYLKSKLQDETEIREVLQESFLAVWTKASYYRPERGLPLYWLMTIARNKLFDRWRRVQCLNQKLELFGGEQERKKELSLEGEEVFENRRLIEKAMEKLNTEEQSLVHAIYLEGKTQKEYSLETQIPLGTIKWRVQRVLSKMKGTLTQGRGVENVSRGKV